MSILDAEMLFRPSSPCGMSTRKSSTSSRYKKLRTATLEIMTGTEFSTAVEEINGGDPLASTLIEVTPGSDQAKLQ